MNYLPPVVEKWLLIAILCAACLVAAYVKGRADVEQKYEAAETRFIIKSVVVKEQDKTAVRKLTTEIKDLKARNDELIKQAQKPNHVECDLTPDRVRRINQASAGLPQGND